MVTNYVRDTGRCDSHLYMGDANRATNADLQLILRVFIRPGPVGAGVVSSVDSAGTTYTHTAVAWGTGQLEKFRAKYKKMAQDGWTNKFWLVPPASYPDLVYPFDGQPGPKARVNLRCRLVVHMLTEATDAHKVIDAVKYVPNPASAPPRANDSRYFQDTPKTVPHADLAGRRYWQNTVLHEVGHALGLPHVGVSVGKSTNPAVPGSPVCTIAVQNQAICYEGNSAAETNDLMGLGGVFSARDAQPWLDRVSAHTGVLAPNWTVKLSRVAPKPVT
jgi:hypothetical protein